MLGFGVNLSGNWSGRYWYETSDPAASVTNLPPPTAYRMTLQHRRITGGLWGDVRDENGMPETGTLRGYVRWGRVFLLKQMPHFWVVSETGRSTSFQEFVRELTGVTLTDQIPHPPVRYVGK
jgi:hypothetical protein